MCCQITWMPRHMSRMSKLNWKRISFRSFPTVAVWSTTAKSWNRDIVCIIMVWSMVWLLKWMTEKTGRLHRQAQIQLIRRSQSSFEDKVFLTVFESFDYLTVFSLFPCFTYIVGYYCKLSLKTFSLFHGSRPWLSTVDLRVVFNFILMLYLSIFYQYKI